MHSDHDRENSDDIPVEYSDISGLSEEDRAWVEGLRRQELERAMRRRAYEKLAGLDASVPPEISPLPPESASDILGEPEDE